MGLVVDAISGSDIAPVVILIIDGGHRPFLTQTSSGPMKLLPLL